MDRPQIFVVGPAPPPVHGLAVVCERYFQSVGRKYAASRFDTSRPRCARDRARRMLHATAHFLVLIARFTFTCARTHPDAVAAHLSAGPAILVEAAMCRLAQFLGARTAVHHHSFFHLERDGGRWYHHLAMRLLRRSLHVVLCPCMGESLVAAHGIRQRQVACLSNAFFVPPLSEATAQRHGPRRTMTFLSAVSASKGIFEFLDVARRLTEAGHALDVRVAGGIEPGIRTAVLQALADCNGRYVGELGPAHKQALLAQSDVLLLPSRHVHEAEPLVMLEALACGTPVFVTPRGCIAAEWTGCPGVTVLSADGFAARASDHLHRWFMLGDATVPNRQVIQDSYRRRHKAACSQWTQLMAAMAERS